MSADREQASDEPRLTPCDVRRCEAMCCYDGVYLQESEEAFLVELVQRLPELAAKLPAEFIVDGYWDGEHYGRKTATRPHEYRDSAFPAHFTRTRCVFADEQGFCELEKLGRSRGQHAWTFKPATCWQFPLHFEDEVPVAPPKSIRDDPYRSPGYPGYSTFVSCGRHDPKGKPWRAALAAELAYWNRSRRSSVLGTVGHTVVELLGESPL